MGVEAVGMGVVGQAGWAGAKVNNCDERQATSFQAYACAYYATQQHTVTTTLNRRMPRGQLGSQNVDEHISRTKRVISIP